MFIDCTSVPRRDRAVVRPEGSPICTVPPPSWSFWYQYVVVKALAREAHQADGVVAVEVHPVEGHEWQEVSHMQRGCRGVDADIDSYALVGEQPVESAAAAGHSQTSHSKHTSLNCWSSSTHPATSLTKPRSSSKLSMLCCAPDRIVCARSSHSAWRTSASAASLAHEPLWRWRRAIVWGKGTHCRRTNCGREDKCLSSDMAADAQVASTRVSACQKFRSSALGPLARFPTSLPACTSSLQQTLVKSLDAQRAVELEEEHPSLVHGTNAIFHQIYVVSLSVSPSTPNAP
jgi:hypothetical protein